MLQKVVKRKPQPKEVNYTHEHSGNKKFHARKTQRKKNIHTTTTINKVTRINNHWDINIFQYQWTQFFNKKHRLTE